MQVVGVGWVGVQKIKNEKSFRKTKGKGKGYCYLPFIVFLPKIFPKILLFLFLSYANYSFSLFV